MCCNCSVYSAIYRASHSLKSSLLNLHNFAPTLSKTPAAFCPASSTCSVHPLSINRAPTSVRALSITFVQFLSEKQSNIPAQFRFYSALAFSRVPLSVGSKDLASSRKQSVIEFERNSLNTFLQHLNPTKIM